MNLLNHWLDGDKVSIMQSPNVSGKFSSGLPDTIVIHFTGGRSAASSARWLCDPAAKASAHVVIGPKGEITQLVPFDTIAWHAGKSSWNGRNGLNSYSIGIEIDNPGRLEKREQGYYTWFGTPVSPDLVTYVTHRNEQTPAYWQSYTQEQIDATEALCMLLMSQYQITMILGHEEISPGRKVDPGPAFPLDKLRNNLLYQDRRDDDSPAFEDQEPASSSLAYVTASQLNFRSAPVATALPVAPPLVKGTVVKVLAEQAGWSKVQLQTEGWVKSEWLKSK